MLHCKMRSDICLAGCRREIVRSDFLGRKCDINRLDLDRLRHVLAGYSYVPACDGARHHWTGSRAGHLEIGLRFSVHVRAWRERNSKRRCQVRDVIDRNAPGFHREVQSRGRCVRCDGAGHVDGRLTKPYFGVIDRENAVRILDPARHIDVIDGEPIHRQSAIVNGDVLQSEAARASIV